MIHFIFKFIKSYTNIFTRLTINFIKSSSRKSSQLKKKHCCFRISHILICFKKTQISQIFAIKLGEDYYLKLVITKNSVNVHSYENTNLLVIYQNLLKKYKSINFQKIYFKILFYLEYLNSFKRHLENSNF